MIENLVFFVHNHVILSITWLFFLMIIIFLISKDFLNKINFISIFRAIELINQQKAIVVDTRSIKCFDTGHIVNSINISLEKILFGEIKELDLDKSCPLILIFKDSHNFHKYVQKLLEYGFNNVYILKNGLDDWYLENLPLIVKN